MSFRDRVLRELSECLHLLREIRHILEERRKRRFSIRTTLETTMTIGNISAGSTGQLSTSLLENGLPFVPPAGSTFQLALTYSSNDPEVTFEAATVDATDGAAPLSQQEVVSVPAGDEGTSVTITISAVDPDGNSISTTITIQLTPGPRVFTLVTSQVA